MMNCKNKNKNSFLPILPRCFLGLASLLFLLLLHPSAMQGDGNAVSLSLTLLHPFLSFQHGEVPPRGYSPSQTAPTCILPTGFSSSRTAPAWVCAFFFLRFLKHVLTESPPLSWCAQLWPAVGLLWSWNCLCLSWVSSLKPLLGWRQFCGKSHLTCTWHTRTMKTWYKCCPAVSIEYRYLTL